jgi:hypothetical protein
MSSTKKETSTTHYETVNKRQRLHSGDIKFRGRMFTLVATLTFDLTAPSWKHATCIIILFLLLSTRMNMEQHTGTCTETGNSN